MDEHGCGKEGPDLKRGSGGKVLTGTADLPNGLIDSDSLRTLAKRARYIVPLRVPQSKSGVRVCAQR